ncbi:MAG: metallophosphoesterase [Bacteroidetes bacterium]|nr:metallophosphoesterase [Bacteroidota bacterium]MBS1609892.1 metallophosphoesterase [Bacteroidota bacterium]
MKRKEFLRLSVSAVVLLANGKVVKANNFIEDEIAKKKIKLRFAVASDGHYGEPKTDYENYFANVVSGINAEHMNHPFSFSVINGDIVHNDKAHYPSAKKALDNLQMKYYVSQGNHDHVTADEWQNIWNMPVNHDFAVDKNSFLIGTSSNEKGEYLCPDVKWFTEKLEAHKSQHNVFIFVHINPGKQTANAVDCPEFFDLLEKYKNVRAVFNGHDHDEEGIKTKNNIPFLFDAHFGGSWGTAYRGFRVVELMKDNSIRTYIMNPAVKINEARI